VPRKKAAREMRGVEGVNVLSVFGRSTLSLSKTSIGTLCGLKAMFVQRASPISPAYT
jgi:hypothetical protein